MEIVGSRILAGTRPLQMSTAMLHHRSMASGPLLLICTTGAFPRCGISCIQANDRNNGSGRHSAWTQSRWACKLRRIWNCLAGSNQPSDVGISTQRSLANPPKVTTTQVNFPRKKRRICSSTLRHFSLSEAATIQARPPNITATHESSSRPLRRNAFHPPSSNASAIAVDGPVATRDIAVSRCDDQVRVRRLRVSSYLA